MTKIQEKYKESIIDLSKIKLKNIKEYKVISYPPAGNDVFESIGKQNNKIINFIIKSERGSFANFDNEIKILNTLKDKKVPKIIETGKYNKYTYIVMTKIEGDKLSDIFKENNIDKNKYLYLYGKELAKIHNLDIKWDKAKQRNINDIPKYNNLNKWEENIIKYLKETKPIIKMDTFIHGDFHYGNILWNNYQITGILDWEYSGLGFKEQDIAWALILRPGQEFMDKISDYKEFLKGYKALNNYDPDKLRWCLVNGLLHFYLMNKDINYKQKIKDLINNIIMEDIWKKK